MHMEAVVINYIIPFRFAVVAHSSLCRRRSNKIQVDRLGERKGKMSVGGVFLYPSFVLPPPLRRSLRTLQCVYVLQEEGLSLGQSRCYPAEKGIDGVYKTLFETLDRHFYDRGLPTAQQSIVDEAEVKRIVDCMKDDKIKSVREIIELIAVDPPIVMISRLITSFSVLSSCVHCKNDDFPIFVSQLRGSGAEHLMHYVVLPSYQMAEVLEIVLLNNANLEEKTSRTRNCSLRRTRRKILKVKEQRLFSHLRWKTSRRIPTTYQWKLVIHPKES